jgi:hypothetical protein
MTVVAGHDDAEEIVWKDRSPDLRHAVNHVADVEDVGEPYEQSVQEIERRVPLLRH